MDKALQALVALIAEGWEFPDASERIARTHKVDGDVLTQAYDDHCIAVERKRYFS